MQECALLMSQDNAVSILQACPMVAICSNAVMGRFLRGLQLALCQIETDYAHGSVVRSLLESAVPSATCRILRRAIICGRDAVGDNKGKQSIHRLVALIIEHKSSTYSRAVTVPKSSTLSPIVMFVQENGTASPGSIGPPTLRLTNTGANQRPAPSAHR